MTRGARFWTLLALFQVAFGLAVFGLTRAWYLDQGAPATPAHAAADWPEPAAAGELEQTMSRFPGLVTSGDPDQMTRQADALFQAGDYARAADLYQRLVMAGSADANTYNSLGITLQYLGRSGEALQVLDQGIALNADYQRIWLTLGYVNSQVGQIERAREALSRAVELGPETDVGRSAAEMLSNLP